MPIITLTTDFGVGSPYVAAMKGVILSIDPGAMIVDISHVLSFQDITAGAQVLEDATPWFPADSIHVAVVDPGVGAARPILYARIGSQQYIAPDNGLLGRLMAGTRPSMVLRLTEREYWLPEVSRKFLGRDIMAPVAVRLSLGLDPRQLGLVAVPLDQPDGKKQIRGEVMSIDSFGNLITNILYSDLAGKPTDSRACVACGIYETFGIYESYGGHAPGMLVALIGSSFRLELAVVGDNAAERTGVSIGTPVVVAWDRNNGG
jgi:S-adenosylmethionine hydrolase